MTKTIWKFPLTSLGASVVRVPRSAAFVAAAAQPAVGAICAWAEVDPDADVADVDDATLYVVETGRPVPDDAGRHLATVLLDPMGQAVAHIYEGPRVGVASAADDDAQAAVAA